VANDGAVSGRIGPASGRGAGTPLMSEVAGSAGNELMIEGADPSVRWKVASTGAWSKYQAVKVGTVKLPAGDGRIVVRPAGPLKGALFDLRTMTLVPPDESPPK